MHLVTVEQRLDRLEERWRQQEEAQVEEIRKEISKAFSEGSGLRERWTAFKRRVSDSELTTRLTNAASPFSTETGLDFIEQVQTIAQDTLLLHADQATNRMFSKIVSRIGQTIQAVQENTTVRAVLAISPAAKLADMILGAAQTFVENKTEGLRRTVKSKLAFADAILETFKERLDPYVQYFGTVDVATQEYGAALAVITQQVNALATDLDDWHTQFKEALGLSGGDEVEEVVALFRNRAAADVLSDSRVQNGRREAEAFSSFLQQLEMLEAAYDNAWVTYLKKYKAGLDAVVDHSLPGFDANRVRALIATIDRSIALANATVHHLRDNTRISDPPESLAAMEMVHRELRGTPVWA